MLLLIISLNSFSTILFSSLIELLPSIRIGKEDVKVVNLIHLFCAHLADTCTAEENAVGYYKFCMNVLGLCWTFGERA